MHPAVALVLGIVVGIALGAVITVVLRRVFDAPTIPQLDLAAQPPQLPDEVIELVQVLTVAAVVVGAHDEVRCANQTARRTSLVQGSRIRHDELLDLIREARHTGEFSVADLEVSRGRGMSTIHYAVRVMPLSEDWIIALADDRSAVRRLDDVRRDFVANVSHELKTPIGAISLLAEAALDASDDPEAVRKFATRMGTEATRLTTMVQQIIELSRLQSLDPLAHGDLVDVDHMLAAVVDLVAVDAEAHDVTIRTAGDRGLVLFGDLGQLTTAMANLLKNALLYSEVGARVVVSARRSGTDEEPHIELSVSDNGIGIAAEDLDRIFERFYRVDFARTRANGGSGLGLAIVKHVAAAHGGRVEVWSRPGEGSTFTITVPNHAELIPDDTPAPSSSTTTNTNTDTSTGLSTSPPKLDPGQDFAHETKENR